ncbi:MAG: hypothetical protein KIT84_04845 [Labilithrix sp.]|nr:hypothetical protein [Labilithrix sp.]MCW5810314.1 hypothetical protein [Labilithrix sp.]
MMERARRLASRAPWVYPALVVLVALGPALYAVYAQTFATLGRDHGIFQYVAWALRHGERAYKDFHEINGPLPHAYFMGMQLLGGEDEHTFRTLDTLVLATSWTVGSLTIPRWAGLTTTRPWLWALAGLAVLGAQYTRYDWWHSAQREALYAALVFASLALQSIAHTTKAPRAATRALLAAGFFGALPWFGKPPCAVFAVLQVLVALHDRASLPLSLRRAGAAAGAGIAIAGALMLAFMLAFEDLARGVAMLAKVPKLHHTIWNETLIGSYRAYRNSVTLNWAAISLGAFLVTYRVFRLPRRALLAVVLPVGGLLVFFGQGKAFPYHLHMLTLGAGVAQLVVVAAIARVVQDPETPRRAEVALAGAALALGLGAKACVESLHCAALDRRWMSAGATPELRRSRAYFEAFGWGDFFANDLRDAAAYVAFKTTPDERVQIYGFDPYFLFLAKRKSASPVLYGFELNVDAALEGGPGARPDAELSQWLRDYRDEAEALVLATVEASPPAAFALFDRAPFTFPPNAEKDFAAHCPRLFAFLERHYERGPTFGTVRLWMRHDVMAR